jgi:hypothetical protein
MLPVLALLVMALQATARQESRPVMSQVISTVSIRSTSSIGVSSVTQHGQPNMDANEVILKL